ncbi:hypothetical protein C8R47DRAFT_1329922 [Mycena vitilis]|nr:hypothetical protein C8R47DRAFT_1329922 [Mycena vitilis]
MYLIPVALFVWVCSVNGYVVREDPSGTVGAEAAVVTPSFTFNRIVEMLTCQPALITWTYASASNIDPKDLTLTITNVDVPQLSAPSTTDSGTFNTPTLQRRDGDITQTVASGVDPSVNTFTWSNVDVSQGWYTMVATVASVNLQLQSSAFYVQNGPDVSCTSTSPSSSSSPTRD